MIKKAVKLVEKGKYQEAEKILRNIIDARPTDTEALFNLSLARREQGDVGEAMELMSQAIKIQPRNATLYFAQGNMQLELEDYDGAEKNFLKSAGFDPHNVNARNGLAFLDIRQHRFKSAEHSLMIALNIDPDNIQALAFIGVALLEQGQHDSAIEYLTRAVALEPESVQAQFCLGKALLASGNASFAEQCFENAVAGEPETAEFRDWLACSQLNAGKIRQAQANFYKALDMGRVSLEVLTGLVKVETRLGNTTKALAAMSQAIRIAPEKHDLALQYSDMLLELNHLDEAISQLQSLQATDFEAEQVALRLAVALKRQGNGDQALKTLDPIRQDSEITPLTRLRLTWALQECGDEPGVNEQLSILLALDTPLIDAVLLKARLMYETADDQGVELLQQLLKRDDMSAGQAQQARNLLALSLARAGEYDSAVQEYIDLADRPAAVVQIAAQFHQSEAGRAAGGEAAVSAMDSAVSADWPKQPPQDSRGEAAFVFAWPGSGRARLLTALGQSSSLYFLPDNLPEQHDRRVRLIDRVGANGLGKLEESNIRMSRRHFWKAAGMDRKLASTVKVIDPQWLIAEMLPSIARYFPGSSVIVLTREPRDMAIAWMQAGYQDLDFMAALYQSQLDLLSKCKAALPLKFIEMDYDNLCVSPELGLGSIQQSLGLESDPVVVDHFRAGNSARPAKPGEWKNYQESLAAVFEKFD
jgi:tetratricopeptide (TPR) repeat protein